ncbi:MAG: LysE family translocator [Gammaproteobacteria bacterium]
MSVEQWWFFITACTILNIAPGPDTMYIMSKTIAQGRRAGLLSSIGVCSGAMIHASLAGLGLSAILETSPDIFSAIKWVGSFYLIYLGYVTIAATFKSPDNSEKERSETTKQHCAWRIYYQAILVDLLNPKTALFFLAFIPQFIDNESSSYFWQFIFLGLVVITNALIIECGLVFLGERLTQFMRDNVSLAHWLERSVGLVLIGIGFNLF